MQNKDKQKGFVLVLTLLIISAMTVLTIIMLERTMLTVRISTAAIKQVSINDSKK